MLMKVMGVVRLTRSVDIRYLESGIAIANFVVASSKKFKTQSGEQKEETTFVECVAFSKLGEMCNQYLQKGSKIYIIGELKLQQWTDQQGQKRSKHSITIDSMEMLDSKQDSQQNQPQQGSYQQQHPTQGYLQPQQQAQSSVPEIDIDNDEIPF